MKINFVDKINKEVDVTVPEINKVTAENLNEIKSVVNANIDFTTDTVVVNIKTNTTAIEKNKIDIKTINDKDDNPQIKINQDDITKNTDAIKINTDDIKINQDDITKNTDAIKTINDKPVDPQIDKNKLATEENLLLIETNKKDIKTINDTKQNTLTAGDNITIKNDVISATDSGKGDVTLAGNNVFTGGNVFNKTINVKASDTAIKFINSKSTYIAWFENNGRDRTAYFGKGSSDTNNIMIGGADAFVIETEKGFDLNQKKIFNIPVPLSDGDATNKKYVDDKNILQDKDITNHGILIENNADEIVLRASLTNNNDMSGINSFKLPIRARDGVDCYNRLLKRVADPILDTDGVNKEYIDNAYKINVIPGIETLIKGRFFNGNQVYEKTITVKALDKATFITPTSTGIIGAIILLTRKTDKYQFVEVPSSLNSSQVYRKSGGSIEYWGSASDKYEDERTITTSYTKAADTNKIADKVKNLFRKNR